MGKVILKTGIKKRDGFIYYLDKNGNVCEVKMAQYDDGDRHRSSAMDGVKKRKSSTTSSTRKSTTTRKSTPRGAKGVMKATRKRTTSKR